MAQDPAGKIAAGMVRSLETELMEVPGLPDQVLDRAHHGLTRVHRFLGNHAAILRALRRDPLPIRRVIDIGCGRGALLARIRRELGADVLGVDLRSPLHNPASVPILRADAVRDALPGADVAVAVCLAHELSDSELIQLIANVRRSCRRFILLDPVRHWLPLALFRAFVVPVAHPIVGSDGLASIRRSYTPAELAALVARGLAGTEAAARHSVAPFYIRQVIDIRYGEPKGRAGDRR